MVLNTSDQRIKRKLDHIQEHASRIKHFQQTNRFKFIDSSISVNEENNADYAAADYSYRKRVAQTLPRTADCTSFTSSPDFNFSADMSTSSENLLEASDFNANINNNSFLKIPRLILSPISPLDISFAQESRTYNKSMRTKKSETIATDVNCIGNTLEALNAAALLNKSTIKNVKTNNETWQSLSATKIEPKRDSVIVHLKIPEMKTSLANDPNKLRSTCLPVPPPPTACDAPIDASKFVKSSSKLKANSNQASVKNGGVSSDNREEKMIQSLEFNAENNKLVEDTNRKKSNDIDVNQNSHCERKCSQSNKTLVPDPSLGSYVSKRAKVSRSSTDDLPTTSGSATLSAAQVLTMSKHLTTVVSKRIQSELDEKDKIASIKFASLTMNSQSPQQTALLQQQTLHQHHRHQPHPQPQKLEQQQHHQPTEHHLLKHRKPPHQSKIKSLSRMFENFSSASQENDDAELNITKNKDDDASQTIVDIYSDLNRRSFKKFYSGSNVNKKNSSSHQKQ
ncbi:hypothetical protein HELRODRAFT_165095 [Helobdella robusta]|uniref:Uncharacterized protein n=1 Tax=Helobdella robusta TaxID=6412 RepID=T1EWA5_HELRO|nr:hypothetical protein HELRODRAFT_165095 [Helobdella robusta]ESN92952.1 hypothetical protein HELRODRAFT_165095 [Helobdella robusta]